MENLKTLLQLKIFISNCNTFLEANLDMAMLGCSFKYFRQNYYHFNPDFQRVEEGMPRSSDLARGHYRRDSKVTMWEKAAAGDSLPKIYT